MKKILAILTMILLFVPMMLFAQGDTDVGSTNSLVLALTPIATLLSVFVVNAILKLNGTVKLLIVTVVSAGLPYLTDWALNADGSWLIQFVAGLASVFVHQIFKGLNPSKT